DGPERGGARRGRLDRRSGLPGTVRREGQAAGEQKRGHPERLHRPERKQEPDGEGRDEEEEENPPRPPGRAPHAGIERLDHREGGLVEEARLAPGAGGLAALAVALGPNPRGLHAGLRAVRQVAASTATTARLDTATPRKNTESPG